MMQLLQQKVLQSLGGFVFGEIDTGLGQQMGRVDSGLCQQRTQLNVLGLELRFVGILGSGHRHTDCLQGVGVQTQQI